MGAQGIIIYICFTITMFCVILQGVLMGVQGIIIYTCFTVTMLCAILQGVLKVKTNKKIKSTRRK